MACPVTVSDSVLCPDPVQGEDWECVACGEATYVCDCCGEVTHYDGSLSGIAPMPGEIPDGQPMVCDLCRQTHQRYWPGIVAGQIRERYPHLRNQAEDIAGWVCVLRTASMPLSDQALAEVIRVCPYIDDD